MTPPRIFKWFIMGDYSVEAQNQLSKPAQQAEVGSQLQLRKRENVHVLGVDGLGDGYGVYESDRIHTAVFGFPGTGKTTLLLSLVLQHIRRDEGFMVVDPHGDLAKKVLTHIPKEKWGRVVYIDPLTAFDENYGMVVQINFLEYKGWLNRDLVARTFMDSLSKIYTRFWGPRLDMILLNALYLLLGGKGEMAPKLSDLYRVLANENFRETLLANIDDEKVRTFWESEYKRMPRDASSSVMTKIYRIVQERIIVPMFECDRSSVDFRLMMDQGLFVIVNLSEGAITSDLSSFLGSLILARVYLAGMSREDTPEEKRRQFYVYVDEAYRFVTASIKDILQSLRKYRVYMTLASQYLEQYREDVALSIPSLCDTIVCFAVGKNTARRLEEFYMPADWIYQHLLNLPKYWFAVSTMLRGRRECQALKCVDYGFGETKIEEVVKHSLSTHGRPVDMRLYAGPLVQAKGELPLPELYPPEWLILLELYLTKEEKKGEGLDMDELEAETLIKTLEDKYDLATPDVASALNLLSRRVYLKEHKQPRGWIGVRLSEVSWIRKPVTCVKCSKETHHPYWLRGKGGAMCRICAERALARDEKRPESFIGLNPEDVGEVYRRSKTFIYYSINPKAEERFFKDAPRGQRGGGTLHAALIGFLADRWRREGCFCTVDLGNDPGKKRPDILVYPLYRRAGRRTVHTKLWDTAHRFAVEVETEPARHPDRVISNWEKCKAWGMPVIFAASRFSDAIKIVEMLLSRGATVMADAPSDYTPGATTVLFVHPASGTQVGVVDPNQPPPPHEPAEAEADAESVAAEPKCADKVEVTPIPAQPPSEAELSAGAGETAKELVALWPIDCKSMIAAFKDWHLTARKLKADKLLSAQKEVDGRTVTVHLGRLDDETERIMERLRIEFSEEPAEAPPTRLEESAPEEPRKTTEAKETAAQPERFQAEKTDKESLILKFADWSLRVKKSGGRLYLYARKPMEGRKVDRSLGHLDDESKSIIAKLGLKVKGLNS
jgi:hypothetical protein